MKACIRQIGGKALSRGLPSGYEELGASGGYYNFGRLRSLLIAVFITLLLLFGPARAQSNPVFFPGGQVPSADFRTLGVPPIQKASSHWSSLAFSKWLLGTIWGAKDPSPEATVKLVMVDVDHDGDSDLVAITTLPRLMVWLNDGRGHFSSWHSRPLCLLRKGVLDPESNEEDAPLLWLEPYELTTPLNSVASSQIDRESSKKSFQRLSLRSPRAPPSLVS
jgi:hypothetical protein